MIESKDMSWNINYAYENLIEMCEIDVLNNVIDIWK
jgi:hypothetical protein